MTKKQLLEDIKIDPSRYFRSPNDVSRDRRFTDQERLLILRAWERDARSQTDDDAASGGDGGKLDSIIAARREVEKKLPATGTERGE